MENNEILAKNRNSKRTGINIRKKFPISKNNLIAKSSNSKPIPKPLNITRIISDMPASKHLEYE